MRAGIISGITTAIATLTQFSVSSELPWSQNGQPLYRKNMKKIYVDQEVLEQGTLFPVLSGSEIFENLYTCRAYLAVDAKNPPSQTDSAVLQILTAKSSTGVVNFDEESDYSVEMDEDVIVYTFEYRIRVATT